MELRGRCTQIEIREQLTGIVTFLFLDFDTEQVIRTISALHALKKIRSISLKGIIMRIVQACNDCAAIQCKYDGTKGTFVYGYHKGEEIVWLLTVGDVLDFYVKTEKNSRRDCGLKSALTRTIV